jgi:hypothetical protein
MKHVAKNCRDKKDVTKLQEYVAKSKFIVMSLQPGDMSQRIAKNGD